ncbi:MAG: hypothetical protein FD161_79 [Limisphaerales bacterium]|nr:MAG: hypothetical protein FD161_79 [Limisphaerales bacterium]KAG0510525.1 MAG: hypothetical protein E1N63_79 [Limisphaerales bacterium]TXT52798.1 MAG: hypothetical protein FD140_341 [Limisphaerales bacterium]
MSDYLRPGYSPIELCAALWTHHFCLGFELPDPAERRRQRAIASEIEQRHADLLVPYLCFVLHHRKGKS